MPFQISATLPGCGLRSGTWEILPSKTFFSGSQYLLTLETHLCFLVKWTGAMRSASPSRGPTGFTLNIQDSIFKEEPNLAIV